MLFDILLTVSHLSLSFLISNNSFSLFLLVGIVCIFTEQARIGPGLLLFVVSGVCDWSFCLVSSGGLPLDGSLCSRLENFVLRNQACLGLD